ncbi:lytic transglycosylase domain-containing protein [Coraliomargarita sp. SDUM461004]|uniref:Lytic transglycosylase domain-containing protein n=1 Tax=Thalassobacterium sedimentorum TaxID=3041258 RepID=A0ABU1AMH0_9BACT|nr:lytic transglycosylase domain-containing protein [Coraliomargarita sp. SDUM461004]MDQ8195991.1 lytic transglycosylase domain-containing protein [Coraliomargarita sp. SDUM461004]
MDHHYHRHERLFIRVAVILGVLVGILAFSITRSIGARSEPISAEAVWQYIEEIAPQSDLDPEFVYALAWAESSLNARARSSVARGLMQLTKPAWREVSDESYRQAWDWRTNVRVGIDYLAFCRDYLKKHDSFTYPLLAAAYRYGPYYVGSKDFQLSQLKKPKNEIYRRIFAGNIRPVRPPSLSAIP